MKEILSDVFQILTIVASILTVIFGTIDLYAKKEKIVGIAKRGTVMVSAITVIFVIFSFKLSKSIENEKDRKLKEYQTNSEVKVAGINLIASNAKKASDSLLVVASKLELRSDSFSLQNKVLTYKIKEAENEIQITKNQTLVLSGENIKLAYKLEQENLERRKLYTALSSRSLEQSEFSKYIGKIQNINVILETLNDEEAIQTAAQLRLIFGLARWNIIKDIIIDRNIDIPILEGMAIANGEPIWNGIIIYRNVGLIKENDYSEKARDALLTQLKLNNIEATFRPNTDELEINTLRIVVGLKPFNLRNFIREWTTEQTFDRIKLKERILNYMTLYNAMNELKLLNTYLQGYILFFIDDQNNIIPLGSDISKLYSLNWDKAGVQYEYDKRLIFKIPEIIEKESNYTINNFSNDIEIKSGEKISKAYYGSGLINRHIEYKFSQLEFIESGILCVIGITETSR